MIEATVIEDSVSQAGKRLTTLQLLYPRFIHAEFMTHRVFSRNASSSRAIPVARSIDYVRTNPAMPVYWGKNKPGMQASEELTGSDKVLAHEAWLAASRQACNFASMMNDLGMHKQLVNRVLEPFSHIAVIVTATEWDNFFELRCHPAAQPEMQLLANRMKAAMDHSAPILLLGGQWHLPYILDDERKTLPLTDLKRVSAARCCRVSYRKHDGTLATVEEDIKLCGELASARPIHASPFEHQATPDAMKNDLEWSSPHLHGNFVGWVQHRKLIEQEL